MLKFVFSSSKEIKYQRHFYFRFEKIQIKEMTGEVGIIENNPIILMLCYV
jgi:hypothetical protein